MQGGPVVLLGQGEQYADPEEWRELIRTRRIRRGVELPVRRDGLTTLRRPEEVPELAVVLDLVDPPGPPSQAAFSGLAPPLAGGAASTSVPMMAESVGGASAPGAPGAAGEAHEAVRPPPGAAPRRRWRFGVWRWVFALGALLLVRLCSSDGFGPLPAFGARADRPAPAAASQPGAAGCAHARGWIAKAACDDPEFAKLRPALARAYAARAASLDAGSRDRLAAAQARWSAGRNACRTDADPGACLSRTYRLRLDQLKAPPSTAASEVARDLSPVVLVDRPEWVRRPDPDELADAYPERAYRLGVDGRALLSCRATAAGGLTACDIVSEDPPDYGFGGAALRLSRFYQLRPRTPEGRPVDGAKVDVPIAFRSR